MTRIHTLRQWPEPALTTPLGWRRRTARTLHRASLGLAHWAARLSLGPARRRRAPPEIEFYAEAGAPEGALYVDGQLIGTLPGVTRL